MWHACNKKREAGALWHWLMSTPVLLALVLAIVMPAWRLEWLALMLMAACVLSLFFSLAPDGRRYQFDEFLIMGRRELPLLWLVVSSAALLMPLPAGLVLVVAVRAGLVLRRRIMPGFPMMDGALLAGALLAFSAS